MIKFFDLSRQYNSIKQEILEITDAALNSGQVINGPYTKQFEEWLAKKNHSKHAITVHSGTSALEVQAEYYKLISGKDYPTVAIPSITFAASANAYMRAGWNVTLLDCNDYGLCKIVNTEQSYDLALLIGIYGHSAQSLVPDTQFASKIVEDGAQHWLSNRCKRIGESTTISFDPTKNLGNYGNGGALVTDNDDLAQFARDWKNHGKSSYQGTGNTADTQMCGTNSRMNEMECAQLLVKAKYIDAWQQRRRQIVRYWVDRFAGQVRTLIDDTNFQDHCYHKFVIDVNNRDKLAIQLKQAGIDTKIHYNPPLNEMNCFVHTTKPGPNSKASVYSKRILSLPIYPELSDSEIEYIADQVLANV